MHKIDWSHHTKLLWWEKRVACALSLNQEPEGFERDHPYDMGSAAAAIRREFDKRMELLSQALASQQVFSAALPGMSYYKHVRPVDFAKWMHGLGLSLPAELLQIIPVPSAAYADSVPANAAAAQPPAANPTHGSKPLLSEAAQAAREAGQRILDANPSWKLAAVAQQLHATGMRGRGGRALSIETIRKALAGMRPLGNAQNNLGVRRMPRPKTRK